MNRQSLFSPTVLCAGFVFILSYLTYFHAYTQPPYVYWDENYHIASAQKYLNNVYFMEQHPPLGKLLIAAGEKLINANPQDNQFVDTDYGANFEEGFSFAGYRFFPVLLAWLAAPIFFFIFFLITRHNLASTFLSFLYIFDNALLVHNRGAMLEGPFVFFGALTILCFLLLLRWQKHRHLFVVGSLLLGVAFALVLGTKLLGLIFILFVPAFAWVIRRDPAKILTFFSSFTVAFALVFAGIWQIHFALGDEIRPALPDAGFYQASEQYKQIIAEKRNGSLAAFPIMIRDSLKYVPFYNRGTPRLDLCKADENGSPFYFWPIGARTINYRWETPDSSAYRYLYLQSNPVVWIGSSIAVLIALCLLFSSVFLQLKKPLENPYLLTVFVGVYFSYLIAISRLGRVMYLYHYFVPLILSFVIVGLVSLEIRSLWKWQLDNRKRTWGYLIFGVLIFFSFLFYRPLTYYKLLTQEQFERRALLGIWEMTCVNCEKKSSLVVPSH